jgi:CRP/FNR family transcriptional regulator, anaerobic regulatory protein
MGTLRLAHGQTACRERALNKPAALQTSAPITVYREGDRHPQAQACAACEVRSSALFGVLDEAGLDGIHTHIASLQLSADDTVYDRGSAGLAVYTVRSGLVRFERTTERGDRRIVRLAGRGDLIGQEALLHRPYADEAIACTTLQLCRIPRILINELAQGHNPLPYELMLRWQLALDAAEAWVADLSTGPARRRVLRLLLRLSQLGETPQTIWLPRRDEMGAMLDMTVETASRLISALRREGVLEQAQGRHAVLNLTALESALRAQDAV